jgi:ABC-type transporter Mla MlaB component
MTHLSLAGDVGRDVALLFVEQLAGLERSDAPVELDLEDAELEDARVVALLVDGVRQAAHRTGAVRLLRPPQTLAHALYRVGALGAGGGLEVVEPREELGSAG